MDEPENQDFQNEFQPKKLPYLIILENLLRQNTNHLEIKETVGRKVQRVQSLTYASIVDTQQKYLKKMGLFDHEEGIFLFIGTLMRERESQLQTELQYGSSKLKLNIKPLPEPSPQPSPEIIQQVEHVLNNIDLPLSLFKRNDNYWSIDNPKTKQANQYLKKMHQQDQKFKIEIKKKKQEIFKQKQEHQNKTIDEMRKNQQKYKQQLQEKINKKIEALKNNHQQRKKSITQSLQFMKQRGKPLFKKIQKQYTEKVQMPSLQQKKRKLTQLRQVMRSVPIQQIQSHRQKYEKQKSQHQQKTIINEPLSVSFKSHFYEQIKSLSLSHFNEMNSNLSMYQKRLQYSRLVKQNHKPAIDQSKKDQMQSRIKLMNKRRARLKKAKRQTKNSDDEDQEQQEVEQEEQQEEQPEPEQNSDDDSDKPRPDVDDQYQPTNKQRYKMGLNNLRVARKLAAKKDNQNSSIQQKKPLTHRQTNRSISALDNSTVNFEITNQKDKNQKEDTEAKPKKQKFQWVSKYDQEQKKEQRIIYKNYLKQLAKNSETNNLIDASQIKKEIQKSYDVSGSRVKSQSRYEKRRSPDIEAQLMYHTNLENKIRNIEERARNQEQLLRFKRINKSQKINKKMAIDDAVVDTIKARLLMMNKTLDK